MILGVESNSLDGIVLQLLLRKRSADAVEASGAIVEMGAAEGGAERPTGGGADVKAELKSAKSSLRK